MKRNRSIVRVRAKTGKLASYIEAGKVYRAKIIGKHSDGRGRIFLIEELGRIACEFDSIHLKGGTWEIF